MNYKTSEIKNDIDFSKSKEVAKELTERYDVSLVNLFELVSEKDILVPASIFTVELSALETISRYLHENLGMSFKKIASLMNRSEKTIWQAYRSSKIKHIDRLELKDTRYIIPISVFADRKLSNLETIVYYLKKTYDLKFSEIAVLLFRDQRTIWTVYSRAKKKLIK